MNPVVHGFLRDIRTGPATRFKNMAVYPVFATRDGGLDYLTLEEALEKKSLEVKEIDDQGSVPKLFAVNRSRHWILLLDGQELQGNKQNRVLNTSILLRPRSETEIPVSCSERGRWSGRADKVSYSKLFLSAKARYGKSKDVFASLKTGAGFRSNQLKVWAGIQTRQAMSQTASSTLAMSDTYAKLKDDLAEYVSAFKYQPGQKGVVVSLDGKIVGMEVVSKARAYEGIHADLIKSFAMEALLPVEEEETEGGYDSVERFLEEAVQDTEESFDSIGAGRELRYEKKGANGCALVCEDEVIHAAFYE